MENWYIKDKIRFSWKGELADLIVLDEDILKSSKAHLKDILVNKTYIDGKLVYQR